MSCDEDREKSAKPENYSQIPEHMGRGCSALSLPKEHTGRRTTHGAREGVQPLA